MDKRTKKYNHPMYGEIWIAPGSEAYALLQDKKIAKLNEQLRLSCEKARIKPVSQEALCATKKELSHD